MNARPPDETDYRHRARVNIVAGLGIGILVLLAVLTVKLFSDHEQMERCINSGRRNCVQIDAPPREGVVVLPPR